MGAALLGWRLFRLMTRRNASRTAADAVGVARSFITWRKRMAPIFRRTVDFT